MPKTKFEMKIRQDEDSFVCEITNGPITLCVNDDGEEEDMQAIVDALNKPDVKWYSNNKLELDQHIEIMQLQVERDQWKLKYDELKERYDTLLVQYNESLDVSISLGNQLNELKAEHDQLEKSAICCNEKLQDKYDELKAENERLRISYEDYKNWVQSCRKEAEGQYRQLKDNAQRLADALDEAKRFIEFIDRSIEIPANLLESYSSDLMNVMHLIDESGLSEYNQSKGEGKV